jgi:hypothetical protein
MRFTEIDALSLEETIDIILPELEYTLANIEDDSRLSADENFFNKITMQDKPAFEFFSNALDAHKASLKRDRSDELFNSVDISKLLEYLYSLDLVYTKYEEYIMDKANEDDQEFFDLLKTKEQEHDLRKKDLDAISYGKELRRICNETLELITGINATEKNLTREQIDVMQQTYSDIQKALESLRPDTALYLLSIAEPDGTIVVEQDIQRLSSYIMNEVSKIK